MYDLVTVYDSKMCNFIAKTGILFLIVLFHFTSSLPFERKKVSEADNELGSFEVKQLLSRLRRTLHEQENEEASLESRFGGYVYDHLQEHGDFGKLWHLPHFGNGLHAYGNSESDTYFPVGNLHYSHPKNWYFNHGPPGVRPYWGDDHGPFCHHEHHHLQRKHNHHGFKDDHQCNLGHLHDNFPPQPWDHPLHFPRGGHNDHHSPDQPPRVLPGTKDAINHAKNNPSSVDDNVTDVTPDTVQMTEKSTKYPKIDVRVGTRK